MTATGLAIFPNLQYNFFGRLDWDFIATMPFLKTNQQNIAISMNTMWSATSYLPVDCYSFSHFHKQIAQWSYFPIFD